MESMTKRAFSALLVVTIVSLFLFTTIICPVQQCSNGTVTSRNVDRAPDKQTKLHKDQPMLKGTRSLTSRAFNITRHDVMVVLHIQKTGGTVFGKSLVQNLKLQRPCEYGRDNIYECKRPGSNQVWLYSRFSTGWVCGPHAGWTELSSCIPRILRKQKSPTRLQRIFYVTWLRDPVERFLSEFGHVRRGATWRTVRHVCNGKQYSLPTCYKGDNWRNVTLQEFLNCPHNLAFNRQTRMVANMSSVGCYAEGDIPGVSETERNRAMLRSAKKNLRSLAFIGLVEYQKDSQFLFERTFGLKFREPFVQRTHTWSKTARVGLSSVETNKIRSVNKLDNQLYQYAEEIFFQRLQYFKTLDEKKPTMLY